MGAAKAIDRIVDVFPAEQQQQIRVQLSTVLQAVVSQQLLPSTEHGRVAAFEIMRMNKAIRNLIRERKTHQLDLMIENAKNEGMQSMDSSLVELYKKGIITKDTVLSNCINFEVVSKQV
jgi:twitching motility protein PilT